MEHWHKEFDRGKIYLSKHNPKAALESFESALSKCPVYQSRGISRILFYIGITLQKLGLPNCAIKSWGTGIKYKKSGYSGKMFNRLSNEYGQSSQNSLESNDWNAFYAIQIKRYLNRKKSHRIGTLAEGDMISMLIHEYWEELVAEVSLEKMDIESKIKLFKAVNIIFPFFVVTDNIDPVIIPVNFKNKKKILQDDRCSCGSGLPYRVCCGRISGEDEIKNGVF